MKFIEALASYIPAIILRELEAQVESGIRTVPYRTTMDTVCMFCDVSGFTKLAEAMAQNGQGSEGLAKYLNQVNHDDNFLSND
jgi:class 3 adenylate cyclase